MRFLFFFSFLLSLLTASSQIVSSDTSSNDTKNETPFTFKNQFPFALVAGGSKGIGYSIAEALAKRHYNLILIARHEGPLKNAKETFEQKYNVQVEILMYDLSLNNSAEKIGRWCTARNIPLKVLCNVVGLGGDKDFPELTLDSLRYMVNLNVSSAMAMTYTFIPLLEKNSPSYILNVGSLAGFAPIPTKNIYASTKSAVIFFSYGLRYQLKKKKISVSCLTPGPVFTKPQIKTETRRTLGWFGLRMAVPVERVGELAVRKTLRRKMIIVPGTLAKVSSFIIRTLPKRMVARIYYKVGT
jgi:uncharacterized protein